jgi:hypothetical protein
MIFGGLHGPKWGDAKVVYLARGDKLRSDGHFRAERLDVHAQIFTRTQEHWSNSLAGHARTAGLFGGEKYLSCAI